MPLAVRVSSFRGFVFLVLGFSMLWTVLLRRHGLFSGGTGGDLTRSVPAIGNDLSFGCWNRERRDNLHVGAGTERQAG